MPSILILHNDRHYCITGDYFNPIPNMEEIRQWLDFNFSVLSITSRADGYTGIWLKKTITNKQSA